MAFLKNIIRNSAANTFGVISAAIMQLISVPVLASIWGVSTYGEWLMLTTIPSYFALTDLGFATAATSDMTMAVARGDKPGAVNTFQSVWLFILLIGLCAVALTASVLGVLSIEAPGHLASGYGVVVFLLVVYSALVLASRTVLAGFRSTGNYAVGTFFYDFCVLAEGLTVLLSAWLYGSFQVCAVVFIVCRLAIIIGQAIFLKRLVAWLPLGMRHASAAELKRLFRPAIAALAIPSALAVNIQGVVIITGAVISPAAVAILSPVRTASRIALQFVGIVNRATMPDFSAAMATTDSAHFKQLLKLNGLMLGGILLPGSLLFAVFGTWIVRLWTGGAITPDHWFVALMALAMMLQGVWSFGANLLLAANRHVAFSAILLPVSAVSIALTAAFGTVWGLSGVAVALIVSETLCLAGLIYASRHLRAQLSTRPKTP